MESSLEACQFIAILSPPYLLHQETVSDSNSIKLFSFISNHILSRSGLTFKRCGKMENPVEIELYSICTSTPCDCWVKYMMCVFLFQ